MCASLRILQRQLDCTTPSCLFCKPPPTPQLTVLPQAVKALLEAGADILQVVAHLMVVIIYQLIHVRKLTLVLPPCILQLGRLVRPTFTFGTASIPNRHPQSHEGVCALLIKAGASLQQV